MNLLPIHPASCHCGAVQFEVDLPNGLMDPRHCNCSMCKRRGAIVASVPLDGLRVTKGAETIRVYRFNTHTAKHYFCPTCGIYTHHQRRSNPEQYSFNVGCLVGVDPFEVVEVTLYDGVNHPRDHKEGGAALSTRVRVENVPVPHSRR